MLDIGCKQTSNEALTFEKAMEMYHKIKEIPVLCDEFSTFELKME